MGEIDAARVAELAALFRSAADKAAAQAPRLPPGLEDVLTATAAAYQWAAENTERILLDAYDDLVKDAADDPGSSTWGALDSDRPRTRRWLPPAGGGRDREWPSKRLGRDAMTAKIDAAATTVLGYPEWPPGVRIVAHRFYLSETRRLRVALLTVVPNLFDYVPGDTNQVTVGRCFRRATHGIIPTNFVFVPHADTVALAAEGWTVITTKRVADQVSTAHLSAPRGMVAG